MPVCTEALSSSSNTVFAAFAADCVVNVPFWASPPMGANASRLQPNYVRVSVSDIFDRLCFITWSSLGHFVYSTFGNLYALHNCKRVMLDSGRLCCALRHVNKWSCRGFLCQILIWSCHYRRVVFQPFGDTPVTPISVGIQHLHHFTGHQTGGVTALDSYHGGVQSFSKLGQSFQHRALKLAATLCRLVDTLVLCCLRGGSPIHAASLYHELLTGWFCPSEKIGCVDSAQACAYEHFLCLHGG